MLSINQSRLERLERLGQTSRLELLGLQIACLSVLGAVLACVLVILFHVYPLRPAITITVLMGLAGCPLFTLGRKHAQKR
ncbi:MAG TPA: hypothetical protein VNM14_12085 [Planctomycetota bacterium]|jgi:hypothetical protein|nr:hypothetical protein [Planctomycetota bacterium]